MSDAARLRALVVDDDDGVRFTLRSVLEDAGVVVVEARDGVEALACLEKDRFVLVVSDLRMPRMDGLELLRRMRTSGVNARFILVTAHGSERHAVEAMKRGAFDYFRKPFDPDELVAAVERAVDAARLIAENERLRGELHLARSLLFVSPAMSRLASLVARVGPKDVTVLVTGESGTGKERVAEAIVRASRRAHAPFLRFNCAALARSLADAELFGHARGAFTGAERRRAGIFRDADGGTVLLDEVGELEPSVQAKLLRVLQDGEIRPVGEDRALKVDVRVIAATHRDLPRLVDSGAFREDLYYRLRVVELAVPPLRARPEDIPALACHFLDRYAERFATGPLRAPPELIERLLAHAWPGNVRELENAIESLVALAVDGELDLSLLPGEASRADAPARARTDSGESLRQRVDAYERGLLVAALTAASGNRTEAARALGIGRATLHEKLSKHGLSGIGGPARDGG